MKLFRHIITIVCIIASFIANAGEQLTANTKCAANQPTAVELQLLQGTWEGVAVGHESHGKITITITGNSFHFHRDTNFWFETTIILPAGTDPKQLHATIKNSSPPTNGIGQVVRAFFKIEDGTLTLATIGDDAEETPKSFEAAEDQGRIATNSGRFCLKRRMPNHPNPNEPKTPNHALLTSSPTPSGGVPPGSALATSGCYHSCQVGARSPSMQTLMTDRNHRTRPGHSRLRLFP